MSQVETNSTDLLIAGASILPDCGDDHEDIPSDTKGSNDDIEETEQYLNIRVENQLLMRVACHIHHFTTNQCNIFGNFDSSLKYVTLNLLKYIFTKLFAFFYQIKVCTDS